MEAWQVLWIVLCFSTGGLNAILGAFGFTLFRAGCRYSIVILAIVLLYAARRLTALQARIEGEGRDGTERMLFQAAAAASCLLLLWDQVPRPPTTEQKAAIARQVEADREFVARMEEALPAGAMVFQLPPMEFPESPLPGVIPYDHLRPYLYSRTLRFSFGSMKGRDPEPWQRELSRLPFEKGLQSIQDHGFASICVNRKGYSDRGKAIEAALLKMGYTALPGSDASGDFTAFVALRPEGGPATSGRLPAGGL
jgi:phosphoglycerol transferase